MCFALSLYTVTHKFTLSLIAHKGKCKGKKNLITRINISVAIGEL